MTTPALQIQDLTFIYGSTHGGMSGDRVPILQNLNVHIAPQQKVGIIGHNGCGKTTFFHLICGLLTPQTGHIILGDRPVQPGEFRPELGLVFQNPDDQLFCASVWEDVAFGPQNMGLDPAQVDQRVDQALAITGTTALADRPPHHLSGGEKRMVAIAGILAMNPDFILYDEPTANLDLRARRRLIQFLHQSPQTLLISSHDLEFLLEVCDRLLFLHQGQILADDHPATLLTDQTLLQQYDLEQPSTLHTRPNPSTLIPTVPRNSSP